MDGINQKDIRSTLDENFSRSRGLETSSFIIRIFFKMKTSPNLSNSQLSHSVVRSYIKRSDSVNKSKLIEINFHTKNDVNLIFIDQIRNYDNKYI